MTRSISSTTIMEPSDIRAELTEHGPWPNTLCNGWYNCELHAHENITRCGEAETGGPPFTLPIGFTIAITQVQKPPMTFFKSDRSLFKDLQAQILLFDTLCSVSFPRFLSSLFFDSSEVAHHDA
jgi:hypothetical protein